MTDKTVPMIDFYISKIDGLPVIHIDTPDDWDDNKDGPIFRCYINDDTDNPIWNNRPRHYGSFEADVKRHLEEDTEHSTLNRGEKL